MICFVMLSCDWHVGGSPRFIINPMFYKVICQKNVTFGNRFLTYSTLTDFQTVFCNGLGMGHGKVRIRYQHPTYTLTHFFIFLASPFSFLVSLFCKILRLLTLDQDNFFSMKYDFFRKKFFNEPLKGAETNVNKTAK